MQSITDRKESRLVEIYFRAIICEQSILCQEGEWRKKQRIKRHILRTAKHYIFETSRNLLLYTH